MFRQLWQFACLTGVFAGCAIFSNSQLSGDYVPIAGLVCSSPEIAIFSFDNCYLPFNLNVQILRILVIQHVRFKRYKVEFI